jgi:hypothetical protein
VRRHKQLGTVAGALADADDVAFGIDARVQPERAGAGQEGLGARLFLERRRRDFGEQLWRGEQARHGQVDTGIDARGLQHLCVRGAAGKRGGQGDAARGGQKTGGRHGELSSSRSGHSGGRSCGVDADILAS